MEFKETKGIFLQIADSICEKILHKEYEANQKLPSVREKAAEIGVNPNTVMRTYAELQNDGIIRNKRGIGFFVEEDAYNKIIKLRKDEFLNNELPDLLKKIALLNLTEEEVTPIIKSLKELVKNEN